MRVGSLLLGVSLTVSAVTLTGCFPDLSQLGQLGGPFPGSPQAPAAPGGVPAQPANTGPGLLGLGSANPAGPGTLTAPGTPAAPGTPPAPAGAAIVCIDPGHPSETSDGTRAADGTTEITVAWRVALQMRQILTAQGIQVVLTKSAEMQRVTNRERGEIANRANAAVNVRLHCDAASGSGFALYAPDRQGTTQGVTGPTPEIIRRSTAAAEAIRAGMARELAGALPDHGVRGDSRTAVGARQGALTGSIFSQVPIVTIEMAVLTNSADARFITSADGQQRMARAICAGIVAYLRAPRT
jgi:N-acetylmuramoyl-L-alanine amidase